MKIRNLMGALVALAGTTLMATADTGDIYSIHPLDADGQINPPSVAYLQGGDTARFVVRLQTPEGKNPFRLVHIGSGSEAADWESRRPKIGIFVSGEFRLAALEEWKETYDHNFTDFIFSYTVKPGDFELPIRLADANRKMVTNSSADSTKYYLDFVCDTAYAPAWTVDNSTEIALADKTAVFQYSVYSPYSPTDGSQDYHQNYDFTACKFNVKTVDFDDRDESETYWRTVHQGSTQTGGADPTLHVEGVPTNTATFYVWSMNESAVKVVGATKVIHVAADQPENRQVATIKILAGVQDYSFQIEGVTQGQVAELVMSATPDFNYDGGFAEKPRIEDYTKVLVNCTAPLPASVKIQPAASYVTATSTSWKQKVTELAVSFSEPFGEDVRVEIVPGFGKEGAPLPWSDYIRFSNRVDEDVTLQKAPIANPVVVIRAGETRPSSFTNGTAIVDGKIYVYALRSDDWSNGAESTLTFGVRTDNANASKPSTEGGIDGWMNPPQSNPPQSTLQVLAQDPAILQPAEGDASTKTYAGSDCTFKIAVSDDYADMTNAFKVSIWKNTDDAGDNWQDLPEDFYPDKRTGVLYTQDGQLPKVKYSTLGANKTSIKVKSVLSTNESEPRNIVVTVVAAKGYTVTTVDGIYEFDEGTATQVKIVFDDTVQDDCYAYLKGYSESDTNVLTCSWIAGPGGVGELIKAGATESGTLSLQIDDGDESKLGSKYKYEVVLLTKSTWSDADEDRYTKFKALNVLQFTTHNVRPTVTSVTPDNKIAQKVKAGGTVKGVFPMSDTVKHTFKLAVEEPGDYDKTIATEGKRFQTSWVFFNESEGDSDHYPDEAPVDGLIYGNPDTNTCTIAFSEAGHYRVEVRLKDKDMSDFDDERVFTFYLDVIDQPTVTVETETGGYREQNVPEFGGNAKMDLVLSLNECNFDIFVNVKIAPNNGSDNPGLLELVTNATSVVAQPDGSYIVKVPKKQTRVPLAIARMDGTRDSAMTGFLVELTIPEELNHDHEVPNAPPERKFPYQYYNPVSPDPVKVLNDNPIINEEIDLDPVPSTNVYQVAAGLWEQAIHWSFNDVSHDFDRPVQGGVTVSITGGGGKFETNCTSYADAMASGLVGFTPNFSGKSGHQTVTLTIKDHDGGVAGPFSWEFEVADAKGMSLVAHGPATGYGAALSKRYRTAAGLGEGRVWSSSDSDIAASFFESTVNCGRASTWKIYGYGYKVGDRDSGKAEDLHWPDGFGGYTTGYYVTRDTPLRPDGSNLGVSTDAYAYNAPTDDNGNPCDSFLYAWLQLVQNDKGSSGSQSMTTDSYLNNATAPEYAGTAANHVTDSGSPVTLPTEKAKDGTGYSQTYVEAVFSRELFASDNMGDINQDGIPDVYVDKYGMGVIDTTTGQVAGDDLTKLGGFNEDEDYLPAAGTSYYSSFIPGLKGTWASVGQPFTARLEIRGYGDALNDAPDNNALTRISGVVPDRIYLDPATDKTSTLEPVEYLAWCEFAAANGFDPAEKSNWTKWSPERPTDPTKADTDDDGFTDGYEYYFWYRAHVGYMDGDVHKYLTGRRYDERNPGEGRFIDSATIESLMDPVIAADGESADTRDTDNDGLPDLLEFEIGTNPFDFDSDGDGLPDGWEVMISGTDPLKVYTLAGISDAMRNFDGDAMAFTTPKLEANVMPKPLHIDGLFSFALVDANGDTDGVQWYAGKTAPTGIVAQEGVPCTVLKVGDRTYVTTAAVATYAAGDATVLATDLDKGSTWTALAADDATLEPYGLEIEGDYVRLMPTRLGAGTVLAAAPEAEKTCCALVFGADVTDVNAAWVYGRANVSTLTTGDNLANQGGFGMLAIGRDKVAKAETPIASLPAADENVAYLHYLVYQEFGFDPRTAWNANTPLAARWGTAEADGSGKDNTYNKSKGGYAGIATRTREYTAYDEFLVYSFFVNNGMKTTYLEDLGEGAPTMAELWYANTTNPQGPHETVNTSGADGAEGETASAASYWGRNSDNGADTDLDGVPDGWELYVMAGPKKNGKFHFAAPYDDAPYSWFSPFEKFAEDDGKTDNTATSGYDSMAGDGDGLNELREFAGTDSCNYYSKTVRTAPDGTECVYAANITRPETDANWLNKFFPTDPWDTDTDKDGLTDNENANQVNGIFSCANFIYGEPADNGKRTVIPGGGLNPCSVDTDRDGLPDAWEAQFAGNKTSVYAGEDADYAPDESKQGNPLQGLTDGMDGTVADAYNTVYINSKTSTAAGDESYSLVVSVDGAKQVVDRDYDHDGLENWQEYLAGAMRCWRYDDPLSPWTSIPAEYYYDEYGIFDPFRADGKYLKLLGIDTAAEDGGVGEFWYKTLYDKTSPAYNPHLVTDTSSGSQYFSRVTNGFDPNFTDTGAYYIFHTRVGDTPIAELWGYGVAPFKYVSCSPVKDDTDGDGMDDYYELFHGLNPLLGGIARSTGAELVDVVYDAWYDDANGSLIKGDAADNFWTKNAEALFGRKPRTNDPENNVYDFELFPWLAGLASADPDGDDLRNQEESLMPTVSPSDQFHHTDPTPLWMTDSSYTNSLVSRFYRLPATFADISLMGDTFEYDGKTWPFYDRDGFYVDAFGGKHLAPFTADHWSLTSVSSKNWAFSFEENEGYDTDHDGISDLEELKRVPTGTVSDPQEADSPHRRQAMYFAGPEKPSALQTMPFVKEGHPRYGHIYPDDMSFREYTVECWVKPESDADSTVLERAIWSSYSAAGDEELLRKNFQLAIKGGCWYTKFDANGTLADSVVELQSTKAAKIGEWTHLATTYDGSVLRLYVNGEEVLKEGIPGRGLTPEYGSSAVVVHPGEGATLTNGQYVGRDDRYWFDVEYPLHAIIIGASAKTQADFGGPTAIFNSHLNVMNGAGWSCYTNFFKGYVDEVRIWDGARAADKIQADRTKRYTAADASANRDSFYDDWAAGNRRYDKSGSKNPNVVPELRYHWSFDSLPGAENPEMAAKAAHGFGYAVENATLPSGVETHAGSKAPLSRPVGYEIAWWKQVLDGYTGTVYCNPAYVTWVPNTVTHLPRFDTTTLDSFYWAGDTKGIVDGTYGFARTAEPVSRWTQYQRDGAFSLMTTTSGARESDYGDFKTTPRRFWQANVDGIGNTSLLFEFTGRHLNQQGDDLLPLGGAFVKYVDEMWDGQGASTASEITGTDEDNNGLADWWQKYAVTPVEEGGGGYQPEDDPITWKTFVTYRGRRMTAGEAYLLDLSRGLYADKNGNIVTDPAQTKKFVNRADEDQDGLPDWWEKHYGIHTGDTVPSGTAHANEDPDHDGLSNYTEYLLSEVFDFAGFVFDPTKARSADEYTPDYFFRVGELYVGEIFADHDLVDDAWEDLYPNAFASRLDWDAFKDADGDGWCNRSENRYSKMVMPIIANQQSHYTAADGLVADYPIPTINLTLRYNGNRQATVRNAPLAIQVTTDTTLLKSPDATYEIGASEQKTAGTGQDSKSNDSTTTAAQETARTRTIGKWSNRHAIGTLTPGNILQNSLALEFCYDPSSVVYSWRVIDYLPNGSISWQNKRGLRTEFDADKRKYGDGNIEMLGAESGYAQLKDLEVRPAENSSEALWMTKGGEALGKVNLVTGEFDLDLGVFAGQYVSSGSNETDVVSLEDQTFRITYTSHPTTDLPRKLYLGAADTGYVREGKNTIIAWAETVAADGVWQVGEPYGIVRDVDVSWKGTSAEIELTDLSPVTPRIDLIAAGGSGGESKGGSSGGESAAGDSTAVDAASDRGQTVSAIKAKLLEDLEYNYGSASPTVYSNALARLDWINGNLITTASVAGDEFRGQHLRVVRWLINGVPAYRAGSNMRTVLDKTIETDIRSCLTEADFLVGTDAFDIDWDNLSTEVINKAGVISACGNVTNVSYLVVIGDGPADWRTYYESNYTVRALNSVVVRKFSKAQTKPVAVAPGATGEEIVHSANPTFKWTVDCPEDEGYTAFNIQVLDGATVVYDSGKTLVPPRNDKGEYEWAAPLFVGDKTLKGLVFENKKSYTWKVSMYNAKFSATSAYSDAGKFYMEVQTNGTDYGTANVAVRYFGPSATYVKDSPVVRVQAFTSADFTGRPVAAGFVEDVTTLPSANSEVTANCHVIGLEPGAYYLKAFVDSNANGVCDPWETQGYLCTRDGSSADYLNPTTLTFDKAVGLGDLAIIYLEDADIDGDGLPDGWEWANASATARANGTFLDEKGVELLTETQAGEALYNKALTDNKELKVKDDAYVPAGGLEGLLGSRFLNNAGMMALAMNAPVDRYDTFEEAISAALAPELAEGGVKITSLGMTDGAVTIALDIETTSGAPSSLAKFFDADGTLTVTCEVLWAPTLAEEPTVICEQDVTVGAGEVTLDLTGKVPAGDSGFFSVNVKTR